MICRVICIICNDRPVEKGKTVCKNCHERVYKGEE